MDYAVQLLFPRRTKRQRKGRFAMCFMTMDRDSSIRQIYLPRLVFELAISVRPLFLIARYVTSPETLQLRLGQ